MAVGQLLAALLEERNRALQLLSVCVKRRPKRRRGRVGQGPGVRNTLRDVEHRGPRLLLVLEDNAEAELIEHYASDAHAQNGFVNSLTEVVVGSNAQVQHYRINLEQEDLLDEGEERLKMLMRK